MAMVPIRLVPLSASHLFVPQVSVANMADAMTMEERRTLFICGIVIGLILWELWA